MKSKLALLLKQKRHIFHTQDIAVLCNILNTNTLYTTIKRYAQSGVLYPLQKGMYSTLPPATLDPFELGIKTMHRYAYISCETVLQQEGYINQVVSEITIVSSQSRSFVLVGHHFRSRQLKDDFLYNTIGVVQQNNIAIASPVRAIADLLYFNPRAHFDKQPDWSAVRAMQKTIGYPITQRS